MPAAACSRSTRCRSRRARVTARRRRSSRRPTSSRRPPVSTAAPAGAPSGAAGAASYDPCDRGDPAGDGMNSSKPFRPTSANARSSRPSCCSPCSRWRSPIGASIELGKVKAPPPFAIVAAGSAWFCRRASAPPRTGARGAERDAGPAVRRVRRRAQPVPAGRRLFGGPTSAVSTSSSQDDHLDQGDELVDTDEHARSRAPPVKSTPAKSTAGQEHTAEDSAREDEGPPKTRPSVEAEERRSRSRRAAARHEGPFAPVLATPTSGPGTLKATQATGEHRHQGRARARMFSATS